MGGANNRSLISAHFCISAYFLTAETYKRMRLTTRVYGTCTYTSGHRLLISRACEHSMIVGGANDLRREAFQ